MLVREKSFWDNVLPQEESHMINKHILNHGIDLRLETELASIEGEQSVSAVITKTGERITCEFVGLTVGVSPNISFLQNVAIDKNRGILVNEFLQTSDSNVYAIGDCSELRSPAIGRRNIEAIWYAGREMGQVAAYNIAKPSPVPYQQGVWFNSAKFLDIEYQVYGFVPPLDQEGTDSLFWENEDSTKSIRIVYNTQNEEVLGFNLMGIRYRHEVCNAWIKEKVVLSTVLKQLAKANFDPELTRQYENNLIIIYNKKTSSQLRLESKRGLVSLLKLY
jgi:NADPH-dependent 2,4-dienoyl-CoA reductase/sulfur reductase-like enzyme